MTLGQRIRQLRKQRGLTVAKLAYRAGIHPQAMNHYECDLRQPNVDNLRRIANALGVTLGKFHDCEPSTSNWCRGRYHGAQRLDDLPCADQSPEP